MGSSNSANQNQIHYNSLSQDDKYDKSDHSTRSRKQTNKIEDNQKLFGDQDQYSDKSLNQDDNYDKSDHSTRSRKQTNKIEDNQSIQNLQQSNQICQIYLSSTLNQAPISPSIRSIDTFNQVNQMNKKRKKNM